METCDVQATDTPAGDLRLLVLQLDKGGTMTVSYIAIDRWRCSYRQDIEWPINFGRKIIVGAYDNVFSSMRVER